jgi:predicted aldo/keto reductase-like oxidoreductase
MGRDLLGYGPLVYGRQQRKTYRQVSEEVPAGSQSDFSGDQIPRLDPRRHERELEQSLQRLNTDYVDLFFVHSVGDIAELDDAKRAWAEKKKAEGKIRLFGFSTHYNMEACMLGAAKLGWIDAIMMSYNFRLMHRDEMKRAVAACAEAGIGLTAMKTQGGGSLKTGTRTEGEMVERLLQKGFTDAQAKLKMVWENPHIASICSEMPNMSILMANVAAALNRTQLTSGDRRRLRRYAHETRSDYCSGCTRICEAAWTAGHPSATSCVI